MNLPIKFWIPLLTFSIALTLMAQSDSDIVLQHRVIANRLTAGETGNLTLELTVEKGFKIGKRPSPKFLFTPPPSIEIRSRVSLEEAREGNDPEYFGEFKPLNISLLPKKDLQPGQYQMEGKLTYIYCSVKNNYCARTSTDLKVPLIIVDK